MQLVKSEYVYYLVRISQIQIVIMTDARHELPGYMWTIGFLFSQAVNDQCDTLRSISLQ